MVSDRVSLSWQQFAWGIALLFAVLASWFNLSNRLANVEATVHGYYSKWEVDAINAKVESITNDHERRLDRLERQRGYR